MRREFPSLWHDQFARPHPRQRRADLLRRTLFQLHPPGRNIAGGNPNHPAHIAHRRQHIRPARFQQRLFSQRSGGDKPHDVARHQRLRPAALLCLLGRLHLFGNRHPAPGLYQPRKISFRRVRRNPAHRHAVTPAGQRNIQHLRGDLRVIKEQLEKVAHAVEQQAILRLYLQPVILGHHRRGWSRRTRRGLRRVHRGRD